MMLYFLASSRWVFRCLPFITGSLLRSIRPCFSALVSFRNFAERGLSNFPLRFDSSSISFRSFSFWDIGRWFNTSPVAIKSELFFSAIFFALLNMKIRQSLQGFMLVPRPCFGFLMISRYSWNKGPDIMFSMLCFMFSCSEKFMVHEVSAQQPPANGSSKNKVSTSTF